MLTLPRLNRAVLNQIVTLSREAVLIADLRRPGFPILFANPAFESLVGVDSGAAVGRHWAFFLETAVNEQQIEQLSKGFLNADARENAVFRARRDNAEFSVKLTPLSGQNGHSRYLLVQLDLPPTRAVAGDSPRLREGDVTSGRRDPDTGLLSYEYFLELCKRDFALCGRQRHELAMITFSIRQFDVYRQTFGEKGAQSCLRMVGGRIAGALRRAGDLCARFDDAGFVALITEHDPDQAAQFAHYIASEVRRLALHHPRASGERYVSCRVGVHVAVPDARDTPEGFVIAACEGGRDAEEVQSEQPAA